jgi:hypothetical protein
MPRPAAARPGGDRRQLAADLAGLRRHRGVRTLLLVMLAMQLLSAPLLSTYLLEVIRLSPGRISGLLAVRTIVGVLTIRRWGAVIDRHGAKRVQVWTALATGLTSLLWLAVRPAGAGGDLLARLCGWPLVLLIGTAVAAAASGLSLAFLVDVQDQVPAPLAPVAFAVQDIISSSQAQMAFLLAGVLVTAAGCNATLACTTGVLDPYRALLVLAAPAAIAIAWLQRRALRGAPVDMPAAQHTTGGAAQPRQGG